MIQRCTNPNRESYRQYGGRGIAVCEEWAQSFESFYVWAISNGYGDNLQIDRIDNDGNYTPENCRWVTPVENMGNTSRNIHLTFRGETHTLSEWARITGINNETLRETYPAGKSPEEILKP